MNDELIVINGTVRRPAPRPIEEVDPEFAGYVYKITHGQMMAAIEDGRVFDISDPRRPVEVHGDVNPGRNDPCPCGSGKKFKKCCGG